MCVNVSIRLFIHKAEPKPIYKSPLIKTDIEFGLQFLTWYTLAVVNLESKSFAMGDAYNKLKVLEVEHSIQYWILSFLFLLNNTALSVCYVQQSPGRVVKQDSLAFRLAIPIVFHE